MSHNTGYDCKPCTADDLNNILISEDGAFCTNSFNEVYPNLFIGDEDIAKCVSQLKTIGITHVINAAHGNQPYQVETNENKYSHHEIAFMGVAALDIPSYDLSVYFHPSADFIENAFLHSGRVLVHCRYGVSRSATLAIAFLMIKRNFTARDAVRLVRKGREVEPNEGFLEQLSALDRRLWEERQAKNK